MSKALIFDLDGTVLNTLDDIGNACNVALKNYGYPIHNLKSYEQMVGNGFMVLMIRALPEGEYERLTEESFDNILSFAKNYYAEHMCERTEPYKGIVESLTILSKKEVILAVLSNKPEYMTKKLIAHYFPNIPFAQVLGGRKDLPLKPDPTRALTMLKEYDCDPTQSMFIGDSNVDMETAKAANMLPIGVAWGFRGAKELKKYGAVKLLQDPLEIADLV